MTELSTPTSSRFSWWRFIIDGIVVVCTIVVLIPALWGSVMAEFLWDDYDITLSDDIHDLNDRLYSALDNLPGTVQTIDGVRLTVPDWSVAQAPLSAEEIYTQAARSVVYISTDDDLYYGSGTGVAVAPGGIIATNYHVIAEAVNIVVATHDGTLYPVVGIIATDEERDVALLKVDTDTIPHLPMTDSDTLAVGAVTHSVAHPEGLLYTYTTGALSAIRDYQSSGAGVQLQITNPISSGSSGGALLDASGQLIGLLTWVVEYEANSIQVQNLNFATPSRAIMDLLQTVASN